MAVVSSISFMMPRDLYQDEKPYFVTYPVEDTDCLASNVILQTHSDITVNDIRGREREFSIDKQGFTIMELDTGMTPEDFNSEKNIQTKYLPKLARALKAQLGASRVQVFEHIVRKRHATFPVSTGDRYKHQQPASVAHIDTSPEWSTAMAEKLNPSQNPLNKRHQTVNVWKPLHGPLRDWPLALCDIGSVDMADIHVGDVVYPDFVVENCQVTYNPAQKWYYLSNQLDSEAWVFVQADSEHSWIKSGVPHSAFPLPSTTVDDVPRESIEVRCIVWY